MPYQRSDDLWVPLAYLSLGLVAPAILWTLAGDLIALYISPVELTLLVAVGYALFAWYLIEHGRIDRTSFLLVSLIWPWPLLFGVLFILLALNQGEQIMRGPLADIFRTITTDWPGSILGYGALFTATGTAVFVISHRYDRLSRQANRLPPPTQLIPGLIGIIVLLAVVTTGANAVATQSAAIEDVGPGTRGFHDPTFNVTVTGPTAELRVTVTAPGGASVTSRLSRREMRGGWGVVPIELDYDDSVTPSELPVRDGTYRVRLTSLAGVPVDTATFAADDAAGGSLTAVTMTNKTQPWSHEPYVYTERNASDTRLGFTITNDGAFHAEMTVVIRIPEDPIVFDHIPMAPGERHGVVFQLAPDTVTAIKEKPDGTVTVELYTSATRDTPTAAIELTNPPFSS